MSRGFNIKKYLRDKEEDNLNNILIADDVVDYYN